MRANVEISLFASVTYGKDKETKEHRKYCREGDFGGGGSGEFEGEEEEYEGDAQVAWREMLSTITPERESGTQLIDSHGTRSRRRHY